MSLKKSGSFISGIIDSKKIMDGWSNILTGIGIRGRDARRSYVVNWSPPIEEELERMYTDPIASKVVDKPIETAFRNGFEWTGIEPEQKKILEQELKRLKFYQAVTQCAKWSRLYGGAVIFKVYNDDLNLEEAPKPNLEIKNLVVLNRFDLWSDYTSIDRDILSSNFGKTNFYTVNSSIDTSLVSFKINAKRTERMDGRLLADNLFRENMYWHDSYLPAIYSAIVGYVDSHESINSAAKDFSVGVIKIKGLQDLMLANEDSQVIRRIQLVQQSKSMVKLIVLDSDNESYEYQARNISGMTDVVKKAEDRLAGESEIPFSILMGQSPQGGMGQSGNHELEQWYGYVKQIQDTVLHEPMVNIAAEVLRSKGIDAKDLGIRWNSLFVDSENEIVSRRKMQADADAVYISTGVLDPSEVRASRFGGDEFSIETQLDESLIDGGPAPEAQI
jgi:phage-related protein (TIGR01555 family)